MIKSILSSIQEKIKRISQNKLAPFSYEATAYDNDIAEGTDTYDFSNPQNIPVATADILQVNPTVLAKGFRSQVSSLPRMLLNHFFGRTSYNLNKLSDLLTSFSKELVDSIGEAEGLATLDSNKKLVKTQFPYKADEDIPFLDSNKKLKKEQIPQGVLLFQGFYDANTNTPPLVNGTGVIGSAYCVSVEGRQSFGGDYTYHLKKDTFIIYNGEKWNPIAVGGNNIVGVTSVNGIGADNNGNVDITGESIKTEQNNNTTIKQDIAFIKATLNNCNSVRYVFIVSTMYLFNNLYLFGELVDLLTGATLSDTEAHNILNSDIKFYFSIYVEAQCYLILKESLDLAQLFNYTSFKIFLLKKFNTELIINNSLFKPDLYNAYCNIQYNVPFLSFFTFLPEINYIIHHANRYYTNFVNPPRNSFMNSIQLDYTLAKKFLLTNSTDILKKMNTFYLTNIFSCLWYDDVTANYFNSWTRRVYTTKDKISFVITLKTENLKNLTNSPLGATNPFITYTKKLLTKPIPYRTKLVFKSGYYAAGSNNYYNYSYLYYSNRIQIFLIKKDFQAISNPQNLASFPYYLYELTCNNYDGFNDFTAPSVVDISFDLYLGNGELQ